MANDLRCTWIPSLKMHEASASPTLSSSSYVIQEVSDVAHVAVLAPALATAALLVAAPSLGCLRTYTSALTDLYKANGLPVPNLAQVLGTVDFQFYKESHTLSASSPIVSSTLPTTSSDKGSTDEVISDIIGSNLSNDTAECQNDTCSSPGLTDEANSSPVVDMDVTLPQDTPITGLSDIPLKIFNPTESTDIIGSELSNCKIKDEKDISPTPDSAPIFTTGLSETPMNVSSPTKSPDQDLSRSSRRLQNKPNQELKSNISPTASDRGSTDEAVFDVIGSNLSKGTAESQDDTCSSPALTDEANSSPVVDMDVTLPQDTPITGLPDIPLKISNPTKSTDIIGSELSNCKIKDEKDISPTAYASPTKSHDQDLPRSSRSRKLQIKPNPELKSKISPTRKRPISSPNVGHTCPRCENTFKHRHVLRNHILARICTWADDYLTQVAEGWECIPCAKHFKTRDQAEFHAKSHKKGRGMICPVCQEDFRDNKSKSDYRTALVNHVTEKHPDYFDNLE